MRKLKENYQHDFVARLSNKLTKSNLTEEQSVSKSPEQNRKIKNRKDETH